LDLRQFTAWSWQRSQRLFDVRRVDIECFARDLEDRGKARAIVARRLCTVVGFYRYAEEEGVIAHSPAVHIRRPRLDYESHVAHLDRNELGAILVAAGLSSPRDHALVSLLALNGLRVSEAIGADVGALWLERGHRTLTVVRKGGKIATMPLAPRVARAVDLAIGDRVDGPNLHRGRRTTLGPPRRWSDRAPRRPTRWDQQASRTPHAASPLHHRRLGRRRALA
jgi:site-specific recombinase XerD